MDKILGVYEITYPKYGMTQVKNLISHEVYDEIAHRQRELIHMIATFDKKGGDNGELVKLQKELDKETKLANERLKTFGEFFTTRSPLWESTNMKGKMKLFRWQGGDIEVELKKVN